MVRPPKSDPLIDQHLTGYAIVSLESHPLISLIGCPYYRGSTVQMATGTTVLVWTM